MLFLLGLRWETSAKGASTHHCISPGSGEVDLEWSVDFLERSNGSSVFLSSSCVGKRNSGHVFTQWETISSNLIGGQRWVGSTPGTAVPTRDGIEKLKILESLSPLRSVYILSIIII